MKKILALLLALAMILALSACGGTTPAPAPAPAAQGGDAPAPADTPAEPAKPVKIGYITSDPSSGFWKEVLESLQNACQKQGVELVYQIASDSAGMRAAYDSLLAQNVDIIVDGYSIEEIANAYAEEAVDSGVPFMAVAFNCPVEGAYSYGTSNDGMGVSFGEFAAESVKKEWDGKIDLIITANAYTAVPAMASRTDKAVETLLATPGFEYLKDVEWVKIDTGLDTSTILIGCRTIQAPIFNSLMRLHALAYQPFQESTQSRSIAPIFLSDINHFSIVIAIFTPNKHTSLIFLDHLYQPMIKVADLLVFDSISYRYTVYRIA